MKYDMHDIITAGFITTLSLILVWVAVVLFVGSQLESRCLKAGYPSSSLSWNFDKYCIKRVDQTDIVVPIGEVTE